MHGCATHKTKTLITIGLDKPPQDTMFSCCLEELSVFMTLAGVPLITKTRISPQQRLSIVTKSWKFSYLASVFLEIIMVKDRIFDV